MSATPIAQLKREALAGLTSLGEALDNFEPMPRYEHKWTIVNDEWVQVLCEITRGPKGLTERPIAQTGAKI